MKLLRMTLPAALIAATRLRRAAVALEAGDADARWLADRLRRYLSEAPRGGATLELVLGLSPAPGGLPWFEIERLDRRDALLMEIATKHFADLSPARAAAALLKEWNQYDRHTRRAELRRGYSTAADGSLRADVFRLAELGDVPAERRLADIFRGSAKRNTA